MSTLKDSCLKKVLIADPIHPDAILRLQEAGFDVTELPEDKKNDLSLIIEPYQAIICRTSTTIGVTELDKAKNLACIALASTGFDRIDAKEASKRNIPILGLPSYNPNIDPEEDGNFVSTAEHAILLILAALGDFSHAYQSMKEGRWEKRFLVGNELANKTVGLVGFGRIAGLVAKRLKGFRVNIITRDPYISPKKAQDLGVELVTDEELYKRSDIISIHVPRTPDTIGMIDEKAFSLMKDGVFIVNTARAAIIDESALVKAINSGKVKRVALDVFHDEPSGINYDLIKHPSIIATPHIGGSTHEAWRRISMSTVDNVISFFLGTIQNQLNPPQRAIILAAGASTRLLPLTELKSKSLLELGDKTILDYQIESLIRSGIKELILVVGYKKEMIIDYLKNKNYPLKITYISNDSYNSTSPIDSLIKAKDYLEGPIIFSHCDVIFGPDAVKNLIVNPNESIQLYRNGDYDDEAGKIIVDEKGFVIELGKKIEKNRATGEYLQIAKFGKKFCEELVKELDKRTLENQGKYTIDVFNEVVKNNPNLVIGIPFDGFLMEVDTLEDYEKALKEYEKIS